MGFEEECLQAHNQFRAQHGVPPLTYNSKLSLEATRFAKQLLKEGNLRSSDQKELGENIYSVKSTNPNYTISGDIAAKHWYAKESEHDYSCEPIGASLPTGNFTQLIWKDSRELAVGVAQEGGTCIVVARYFPAGNIRSQFCDNVLPRSTPSQTTSPQAVCTKGRLQPSTVPKTAATTSGGFNTVCLNQHNYYRSKHGVAPLELDTTLCEYSQDWANKLAQMGTMQHRDQNTFGENIFSAWSSDPNYSVGGGKAVDAWYDEIKFYTFGREPTDLKAGHFTQVVWKACKTMGVGMAKKNGHIYVVCNYSPPGNYVGNYTSNVPAPL